MNRTVKRFIFLGLLYAAILLIAGCAHNIATDTTDVSSQDSNSKPNMEQTCDNKTKQTRCPKGGDKIAIIETSEGTIKALLFPEFVPETIKNFEELAKDNKYDGVIFHRVIKGFMIQTGDFENNDGTGGYSYSGPGTNINDEFSKNLAHLQGTLAMANSGPNTNGSQFFIVHADEGTPWLNGMHSIFGQVYEGLDIVDKISNVEVGQYDKPTKDVRIISVKVRTL